MFTAKMESCSLTEEMGVEYSFRSNWEERKVPRTLCSLGLVHFSDLISYSKMLLAEAESSCWDHWGAVYKCLYTAGLTRAFWKCKIWFRGMLLQSSVFLLKLCKILFWSWLQAALHFSSILEGESCKKPLHHPLNSVIIWGRIFTDKKCASYSSII